MNFFSALVVQFVLSNSIFFLSSSLSSHLGNSAEFTEFYRFIPSFTRFNTRLVSSVDIDAVRTKSITNRPSHTKLGQFLNHGTDRKKKLKENKKIHLDLIN